MMDAIVTSVDHRVDALDRGWRNEVRAFHFCERVLCRPEFSEIVFALHSARQSYEDTIAIDIALVTEEHVTGIQVKSSDSGKRRFMFHRQKNIFIPCVVINDNVTDEDAYIRVYHAVNWALIGRTNIDQLWLDGQKHFNRRSNKRRRKK